MKTNDEKINSKEPFRPEDTPEPPQVMNPSKQPENSGVNPHAKSGNDNKQSKSSVEKNKPAKEIDDASSK